MKYLKQALIILFISFLGELMRFLIPLPIPGSIYGMLLLFLGLCTRIIPLDSIKDVSKFLIEIMPIMFIPPAVGLIDSYSMIKSSIFQYVFISVITTVIVMVVAGHVTQFLIRRKNNERDS